MLENSLAGRERIAHMAEAPSVAAVLAMLPELGIEPIWVEADGKKECDREQTLTAPLRNAYREIGAMIPSPLHHALQYPYDAHNVKAIIKCRARGISPRDMLIDLGSASLAELEEQMQEDAVTCLPQNLACAAKEAAEEFAKTGNPQVVDLIVDRAAYADMRSMADAAQLPYLSRLVSAKIDLLNGITCLRILRMHLRDAAEPLMKEAYLAGGSFSAETLCELVAAGNEEDVLALLTKHGYADFSAFSTQTPLWLLEKTADDIWMSRAKEAKYVPFGAPVLLGYLIALEYQTKNIRIILAGKDTGLSSEIIRERLRATYA